MPVFDTTNLPEAPLIERENGRNCANGRISKTKYKGLCWCKKTHVWRVEYCCKGGRLYLGSFTNETEAARVYAKAHAYFAAHPGAVEKWVKKQHEPRPQKRKQKAMPPRKARSKKHPRYREEESVSSEDDDDDEEDPNEAVPDQAPSAHVPMGHGECLESKDADDIANLFQGYGALFAHFCEQIRRNSFNGKDLAYELDDGKEAFDDFLQQAGIDNFLTRRKIYRILESLPRAA